MADIRLSTDALAHRGQAVSELLRPIAKVPTGPAWRPQSDTRNYVIGAYNGQSLGMSYRQWRFSTYKEDLTAAYFEWWRSIDDGASEWILHQAYLHIYKLNRYSGDETEILCLHCDPDEPDSAAHAKYKQGPHLHLMQAQQPLPHSHIALHCGHLDIVLASPESLTSALSTAIVMIRDEVLEAM